MPNSGPIPVNTITEAARDVPRTGPPAFVEERHLCVQLRV